MYLLNSFEVGGTEMNAVRTVERLDPRQVRLSVAAFRPHGPLLSRYEQRGIPVHRIRISSLYGPSAWSETIRLAGILRRDRIEVLHTHDVYCNIFGAPAGLVARTPGILCSRRWWKRVPRPGLLLPNRVAYALADRVLANSRAVAAMLEQGEHVPRKKISLVPNFVEADAFGDPSPEERRAWRRAHGLPDDAVLFGTVGRLAPVKDNATLIRALALLGTDVRVHVVLIGDGEEREMLAVQARQLGVASRVHFLGMQPNRPNPHRFLDVSVLCSLSEGFPNSMLEAMAAARPVIATPVGGVTDALVAEETGLLFPVGDAPALAAQMQRLATDPELRLTLGRAGNRVARSEYAEGPVLEQLLVLYEALAGRSVR